MPVEENQAAMEARWYSWVTCRGWSHHHGLSPHASIGSWTIERLAHQMPDALNYRVGLHSGCPFKCLMHWSTEWDPRQGIPLSAWTGRAMEKDWPERLSDGQPREARKKTGRAITPATEAVCVPAHLAPPGSSQAKQLRHLHAQLSLGQSCHRPKKKKKSCIYACSVTSVLSDCLWPCRLWPARLLCQRRGSPGKNTGVYWPILVVVPF